MHRRRVVGGAPICSIQKAKSEQFVEVARAFHRFRIARIEHDSLDAKVFDAAKLHAMKTLRGAKLAIEHLHTTSEPGFHVGFVAEEKEIDDVMSVLKQSATDHLRASLMELIEAAKGKTTGGTDGQPWHAGIDTQNCTATTLVEKGMATCVDKQKTFGDMESYADKLGAAHAQYVDLLTMFGQKVNATLDKDVGDMRQELVLTRHESLLVLLLSERAKFTPTDLDGKARGIRRKLKATKTAKWQSVYAPLRAVVEAIMSSTKG